MNEYEVGMWFAKDKGPQIGDFKDRTYTHGGQEYVNIDVFGWCLECVGLGASYDWEALVSTAQVRPNKPKESCQRCDGMGKRWYKSIDRHWLASVNHGWVPSSKCTEYRAENRLTGFFIFPFRKDSPSSYAKLLQESAISIARMQIDDFIKEYGVENDVYVYGTSLTADFRNKARIINYPWPKPAQVKYSPNASSMAGNSNSSDCRHEWQEYLRKSQNDYRRKCRKCGKLDVEWSRSADGFSGRD